MKNKFAIILSTYFRAHKSLRPMTHSDLGIYVPYTWAYTFWVISFLVLYFLSVNHNDNHNYYNSTFEWNLKVPSLFYRNAVQVVSIFHGDNICIKCLIRLAGQKSFESSTLLLRHPTIKNILSKAVSNV